MDPTHDLISERGIETSGTQLWSGEKILTFLGKPRCAYPLLLTVSALLFLPGIASIPPCGRDEANYAQASRQMLSSGDFVQIRFHDKARHKKPAGIHWLQSLSVAALSSPESTSIWPYRLPSVIGATASVLLTYQLGSFLLSPTVGLLAALILGSSMLLIVVGHLATTDAVVLALAMGAQYCFARIYVGKAREGRASWIWPLLFWVAQGLGVLTKGPFIPVLSLLTALALLFKDRKISVLTDFRPWWGFPILCALVAPWYLAINRATEGAFAKESFFHDILPKILGGDMSHGAPPGYHTLLLIAFFFPASLLIPVAVKLTYSQRGEIETRFLFSWLIPFWMLFELIPTKLPHYVLPAYPVLAILLAFTLVRLADRLAENVLSRWVTVPYYFWSFLCFLFGAVVIGLPWYSNGKPDPLSPFLASLVWSLPFLAKRAVGQPGPWKLAVGAAAISFLVTFPTLQFICPKTDLLWLSRDIALTVESAIPQGSSESACVAISGHWEPDLVFYLGTQTRFIEPTEALEHLLEPGPNLALIEEKKLPEFQIAAMEKNLHLDPVRIVEGFNLSKGNWRKLYLFEKPSL